MPFTNAQFTTFFEDAGYLRLTNNTRLRLEEEGITTHRDLVDFESEQIDIIASNLRRAIVVEDAAHNPPYRFGANVQKRLS